MPQGGPNLAYNQSYKKQSSNTKHFCLHHVPDEEIICMKSYCRAVYNTRIAAIFISHIDISHIDISHVRGYCSYIPYSDLPFGFLYCNMSIYNNYYRNTSGATYRYRKTQKQL